MAKIKSLILQVPVAMKIGPVPEGIESHSQLFAFGLANFQKILTAQGITTAQKPEFGVISYAVNEEVTSFTSGGVNLNSRHYRLQPEDGKINLELSEDGGENFEVAAVCFDTELANKFGRAWAEGRTEESK